MGSNDQPPPHVNPQVKLVCNTLLQIGGTLWTISYLLYLRESLRSKSYGMPIFALALNFSWEFIFAFFVAEQQLEKTVFSVWMLIDCGLVYGLVRFGKRDWAHSPFIARNLIYIFLVLLAGCTWGHWAFCKWWLDNDIGQRPGKLHGGRVGPDTTELGYWTSSVAQVYASVASLAMLMIRGHSGGVNYSIWATRALGTLTGLHLNYVSSYYYWPDGHPYFVTPFSIFLVGTAVMCDVAYPFVLNRIRRTEITAADGSKSAGTWHFDGQGKKKGR